MDTRQSNLKTVDYLLIISLLTLFTPLVLFVYRSLDDNRLTSWKWVFANMDAGRIFLILVPGIMLAYLISRISFFERNPTLLFLSSFVIAAAFWREPEVIVDTSRYFTQAKHLEMYGIGYFISEWGKDIVVWTDLPLVPFLYGLIFKFLGESRLYIQIFTTLLYSLTLVLTYMIGKTLWDEDTGFYAGLLLLGIPYLFTQVPLMLVDVPTMFFLTLSVFTFIKALSQGGLKMTAISSVALFLAFFSKYSTWLMLSVLTVIFVVYLRMDAKTTIKRAGAIALVSLFLIGVAIIFKYDVISEQIRLLMSYQRPGLRRWGESFTSTFLFQIHPFITVAALYSLYVAFRKRDLKYMIVSYLILLVVLFQIKRIRYIIPLFPMLALMASYGLREIRSRDIRKFIVFCIITSSLVFALSAYLPFLQRISTINLKNAGQFLNSLDVEDIEVFTLPQKRSVVNPAAAVPVLDLFTDKRILYDYKKNMRFGPRLSKRRLQKSSLRFTWEYKNPEYYTDSNKYTGNNMAVVVISDDPGQPLPNYIEEMKRKDLISKVFKISTGIFRYRTIVTVYSE
ncbi:hypothetical protein BMS3Abin08_01475 [bacterium BMS3Abin08]|nr:hypothetical protein BMS3Abin08_01475 [bacterium BMS3Abin08]